MTLFRGLFLLLFFVQSGMLCAQLDTIHWFPPLHARSEEGPQFLYLSTPEAVPFQATIRDGQGTIITTALISNAQPFVLSLGSSMFTKAMVSQDSLHRVLDTKGLVIDGEKPFYAYFRVHSNSEFQAGDLTCKGRAALGTTFRIGHLLQGFNSGSLRSNFFSVMATEDNTMVSVSEFEAGTKFRVNGINTALPSPVQTMLNKGQTMVFAQYSAPTLAEQPVNGFMGSLVSSTKPIVVNTGSWTGAPVNFSANDIGIDQIVPIELVGDEYILCRGNGSDILERPIIVAHTNQTEIFINGSTVPEAVLQAGDWIALKTDLFTSVGNMYIQTSEPVYIYQMVGGIGFGDDQYRTAGLVFVPPLSCGIPDAVDHIYLPNQIGSMDFDGGMMITAMRDSMVELKVDGITKSLGPPGTVMGNPDFVTYRQLTLFNQSTNPKSVSVKAHGAVQVALFGRNDPASFAGFFSGFTITNRPNLSLKIIGDGVCPDTLEATGHFDGVQWMYNDSLLQYGPDSVFIAYAPGEYVAIGYLGVCRRTDFASDTIEAVFNSPAFPYEYTDATCFGFTDGSITFGTPSGGIAPYQFSVDNGRNFSSQDSVIGLGAGLYSLVVKDSTGCYNRPLSIEVGQRDSFIVTLEGLNLPDPLYTGQLASYIASTERPIVRTEWLPFNDAVCADCLRYSLKVEESEWVSVTVYDEMGCPSTARIFVQVTPDVYAPNVYHPGSDQGNEAFTLFSKDILPIKIMRIYDRWGGLVFEKRDIFTNDLSSGWDGTTTDGKKLNPAVFVWVAQIELTPGNVQYLYGDVTLVR
jgi:hypothetical protein